MCVCFLQTLYLKNLNPKTSEEDLVSLFARFQRDKGPKVVFRLMKGRMKGQAFVSFEGKFLKQLGTLIQSVTNERKVFSLKGNTFRLFGMTRRAIFAIIQPCAKEIKVFSNKIVKFNLLFNGHCLGRKHPSTLKSWPLFVFKVFVLVWSCYETDFSALQ